MKHIAMSVILLAAALNTAPAVEASGSICVERVCAHTEDETSGTGTCDDPGAEHDSLRGVGVTYEDESSATGAYVYQYCYATEGEDGSTQTGRWLSVAVTRFDWSGGSMHGVVLYWESHTNGDEGGCVIMVHGHLLVTSVFDAFECVAGGPPMVLPPLP